MSLFKNLVNYEDPMLREVTPRHSDKAYLTDTQFQPGFALGLAFGNKDAPATVSLAVALWDSGEFFGPVPVIAQQAILVNCAFRRERDFWSIDTGLKGDCSHDVPLKTYEAMEKARIIADKEGLGERRVLYVAHPAHMERVMRIGEKLGFEGEPFVEKTPVWNDRVNDYTKSPEAWKPYEIKARVHHLFTGRVPLSFLYRDKQ
jgi:hypothetical protein